ncbi:MAG TPA: Trk system potassium transporter TrkA [Kiritimatiellia bacterium]|nr:Trk system potassium transporter TrkA [Kiritimatiellia bacterium]
MNILILGAGNAGTYLATKLSAERHNITVVDTDENAINRIQSRLDVGTLIGDACQPDILTQAGISKTDLLLAVTNRDEVNILSCALAHLAGVRNTVARVAHPQSYRKQTTFDLQKLGIDLLISQKEECAIEIYNILRMPGTIEAIDLFDGKAIVAGMKVHMDSPMLLQKLKTFSRPDLLDEVRFIALLRGGELILATGNTQFMIGDEVYFVATADAIRPFLKWAHPEHEPFERIIICGGGDLGLELASKLEGGGMKVTLVERDEIRAQSCAGHLDKTLVILGDALQQETLANLDINHHTAVVAATGDDETNIMICLLAEEAGASFTLAQVAKPDYVPIINNLSLLDRAVSSHMSLINSILHFVRGKHVQAVSIPHRLPGEFIEMNLPESHSWCGKAIRDLKLGSGLMVAMVFREGILRPAVGTLTLKARDQLILYASPGAATKLADRLNH